MSVCICWCECWLLMSRRTMSHDPHYLSASVRRLSVTRPVAASPSPAIVVWRLTDWTLVVETDWRKRALLSRFIYLHHCDGDDVTATCWTSASDHPLTTWSSPCTHAPSQAQSNPAIHSLLLLLASIVLSDTGRLSCLPNGCSRDLTFGTVLIWRYDVFDVQA